MHTHPAEAHSPVPSAACALPHSIGTSVGVWFAALDRQKNDALLQYYGFVEQANPHDTCAQPQPA